MSTNVHQRQERVKPLRLLLLFTTKSKTQRRNKINSSASPGSEFITGWEGRIVDSKCTEARAVTVILIIMNIITASVTSLLNGLVIIAVKTKLQLKTMSNIALACLAITDCFMGVIGQPTFIALNIVILQVEGSNTYCFIRKLSNAVLTVLSRASLLHLALMFLDRYIAIKHPYKYTSMVTRTRILCSATFVWIVALLSTATSFSSNNNSLGQLSNGSTIIAVCCAGIIIFCPVVLYYEARRQEKQIAAHHVSEDNRQKFVKEKKALKLTTTVLFFLVLSYPPLIVINILIRISFIESLCAAHIALAIASFLFLLNSLVNPTIYCIRRRQFRVAFIEILLTKSNVQAQETEMRMNRAPAGLRWRSQNDEQKNSLSTANNTVNCGVNNIGSDKDQCSNFNYNISYTNSKNKGDDIISDNKIDNSKNSIGGLVSLEATAVLAVTAKVITLASPLMTTTATVPFKTMKLIAVAPTLVKRQNAY